MNDPVRIELAPRGAKLHLPRGSRLQDALFDHGVEFPCGGRGLCRGCKIRVLSGSLPITVEDHQRLSSTDLAEGWRLACRARADSDLKLELGQWEAPILTDNTPFDFTPQEGWGVAVDLGTTTVVGQLVDLRTGEVLAVNTALNAQARHGADIMSRIEYAVSESGQSVLERLIRQQVGGLIQQLLLQAADARAGHADAGEPFLKQVVLVGNTVMHHLFCGLPVEPLSHFPFEPVAPGLQPFSPAALGWPLHPSTQVRFLPCLGGFVGSDILAGVLATKLHEAEALSALIDLGTNGEIVVGNRDRLVCASTAAGPAFEGARISMGMRAATGAISAVQARNGRLHCHVLGGTTPRGLCGSGLVDVVAASLDLGWIKPNGRLSGTESLLLAEPVRLTQWDVRELQLAKGAIAAGVRILLRQWPATRSDLKVVYLAGAFGNYINEVSAQRIGLLDFKAGQIAPAGNTALLGAKLALFSSGEFEAGGPGWLKRVEHISLHEDPEFQEIFAEEMRFPLSSATEGAGVVPAA